jgi:hypothetical protein
MKAVQNNRKQNVRACLLIMIIPMAVLSRNSNMRLPESVGAWKRSETQKRVTEKSIFEYMDGAGEMYVGFRFDGLDVFTYQAPDKEDILVELYWMKSPDDAFGLLSMEWSGESVIRAGDPSSGPSSTAQATYPRCLYAAGLLRIWSDNLFARIMTFPETPESREAVMQIGRAVVAGRGYGRPPVFLNALPPAFSGRWEFDKGKTGFLRSHLVLNSFYFISFSNILGLDLRCEAVCARYRPSSENRGVKPFFLLIIRYPDDEKAAAGMRSFQKAYFPEIKHESVPNGTSGNPVVVQTESGWSGHSVRGRIAVLGFEWPDEATGKLILQETLDHLKKSMEESHGP